MKAVIPAAGLGTRFLPYTKSQPKEMLPVVDKPAIQYVVEEAVASGIHELLIVTARGKRAIEDHFDRNIDLEQHTLSAEAISDRAEIDRLSEMASIFYVRQKQHRGLGDAVSISEEYVGEEPFSVLLGDDLTFGQPPCQRALLDFHRKKGVSVIAVQRVPPTSMGRYGMVEGEQEEHGLYRIHGLVEKPAPERVTSDLATLGRYVFTPSIFAALKSTKADQRGEIQLTDAIGALLRNEDVFAYLFEGQRYDVGDKIGWLQANVELALDRPEMRAEVLRMLDRVGVRQASRAPLRP